MHGMKINNKLGDVQIESYEVLRLLDSSRKKFLTKELGDILRDSWGTFPEDFIEKHIISSAEYLVLARLRGEFIGFCALSIKKILSFRILYIEFLVLRKNFQNLGLSSHLCYLVLRPYILKNFLRNPLRTMDIMFISPNIRVVSNMRKFASFIYPDPFAANSEARIPPADDTTWNMARELIKNSDNPNRRLNREGLVLEGSYASTPWLIYDLENIPWHIDSRVNKFAEKYLGYGNREDKEFVVRARIDLLSLFRYLFRRLLKNF